MTLVEYAKKADAICAKAEKLKNAAIRTAFNNPKKFGIQGSGETGARELIRKIALPPIATMIEGLESLEPPKDEEEQAEVMVKAYRDELEHLEAKPGDALTVQGPFVKADKLAKDMKLKDCAAI